MTIITPQRLPDPTLDHAQLVVDRAYLLRKLKDALDPLKVPMTSAQLGLKLFGHLDCPDARAEAQLLDTLQDVFSPDQAQRLAIQRALASELLMILGPPGTGKTDVLAAIALLYALLYTHRVLICLHTNIAIDNAILRLVGMLKRHGLEYRLDEQFVVRFGDPHLAELETDDYRNVTMSLIVADSIQLQREEIARLERRRDLINKHLTELPKQQKAWEQRMLELPQEHKRVMADLCDLEEEERATLTPIQQQRTRLKEHMQQAEQSRDQALASWRADEAARQTLVQGYQEKLQQCEVARTKLKQLSTYKPFKRFWIQLITHEWDAHLQADVKDLSTSLDALEKQIEPIQQRQAVMNATYWQAEQRCKDLQTRITSWTEKRDEQVAFFQKEKQAVLQVIRDLDLHMQEGNAHIAQLEQTREKSVLERALIEDTLARLDQQVIDAKREAARKVVEGAHVVGATLTGLYLNPVLLHQEWDVVILYILSSLYINVMLHSWIFQYVPSDQSNLSDQRHA